MKNGIRIIPPRAGESGITLAQGTKVMVGDVEVAGVFAVTLRAETDDIWRATIECHAEPPAELMTATTVVVKRPENWLSRFLRWVAGKPRNITHLASNTAEWAP